MELKKRKCFHPWTYNKFVYEMPEIGEAALFCQRVWIVSIPVHHATGLQSAGTLEESGHQLLQTVLGSKMEQRGELLATLI